MRTASVNPARSTRRGRLRFLRRSSGPADGRRAAGPHRVVVRPRPGPGYYVSLWSGLLLDEPGILVWSNSAGERYGPVHREMQHIAAQAVQLDGDQARPGMQLGQGRQTRPDSGTGSTVAHAT